LIVFLENLGSLVDFLSFWNFLELNP
jgi:hypothetical protein